MKKKAWGATPFDREELIAPLIVGQGKSVTVHRRGTGMGSAGKELHWLD